MKPSGFTLIELLAVVMLVAVLATLAGPNFTEFLDRRRLVNQAEDITNMFQLARSEAIKHSATGASRSIALTITPAAPWYVGLKSGTAACDGTTADCATNDGGNAITRLVTATECTGCTLTAPAAQQVLVFNFRGLVAGASDVPVTIRSPRGKQLTIMVSKIGRLSVCSPAGQVTGYPTC